jgi:small subunit ribosomal protein S27Ae
LVDYDISQDATIQLVFSLEGGAKKRKKKQYTTPKKIKHKHKKYVLLSLRWVREFWVGIDGREKLATLKYYSVDSDGKIQRLRRECPSETCGAGIFMAFHEDRQYCGKCHTTCMFLHEVADDRHPGEGGR